jgi:hypothetical protein
MPCKTDNTSLFYLSELYSHHLSTTITLAQHNNQSINQIKSINQSIITPINHINPINNQGDLHGLLEQQHGEALHSLSARTTQHNKEIRIAAP